MNVSGVAPIVSQSTVLSSDSPRVRLCHRDVLIVNPALRGNGDLALAKKIANIALGQGCRVSTISIAGGDGGAEELDRKSYSPGSVPHTVADLHKPLFVIAPVGILRTQDLQYIVERLYAEYNFRKEDVLLIEEMDVDSGGVNVLGNRTATLMEMGFKKVDTCALGFDEGAVGYLPVDETSQVATKSRFEGELKVFLDGFNLSLNAASNYHLAYIGSSPLRPPVQLFLANALRETQSATGDSNFVMVIGDLKGANERNTKLFKEWLSSAVMEALAPNGTLPVDCHALFAHANIYFPQESDSSLIPSMQLEGSGSRSVNVVFVSELPPSIFQDFICLSTSGMATGDQSLSEFLSITGEMPHYDMQRWKHPMFSALKRIGSSIGGSQLEQWVSSRVTGPVNGSRHSRFLTDADMAASTPAFKADKAAFNKALSSRTADGHIRMLLDQARSFV